MKATQSGNFKAVKLPEPQNTVARCYSLIDIGTVPNVYLGQLNGKVHKIFITFELPKLKAVFNEAKGEEPFVVSEELTLSTKDNSNLAKLVAAWRNKPFTPEEQKGFDPTVMVGKTALIQLMHRPKAKYKGQTIEEITNENTNLKMQAIMSRPKDMEMPAQINPTFIWDWDEVAEKGFDKEKWEKIPNFLKDKIRTSDEFKVYAPGEIDGQFVDSKSEPVEDQPKDNTPVGEGDQW